MRFAASTTPGHSDFSFADSPRAADGTAEPISVPPALTFNRCRLSILFISTTKSGSIMPVFIRTSRSVPPARIRDSPDSLASSAAAALVVVGASNLMDDSLPFALSRCPLLSFAFPKCPRCHGSPWMLLSTRASAWVLRAIALIKHYFVGTCYPS